jgi:hypothetical protein
MGANQPLTAKDVRCLGHLRKVFDLLDGLAHVGCERDRAGNRKLHFNAYCKLVLLYVWNPLIDSVRVLQQAAGLATVARALGVGRFSLGSFSESVRAFDPDQLRPVVAELGRQVAASAGGIGPRDPRLAPVEHAITLVDGTVLTGLTRLTKAACGPDGRYTTAPTGKPVYGWRLHTQLDLATFAPHRVDRTGARNGGDTREGNVLRRTLAAGRCYVGDGGYADQALFDDVAAAGSSFVIRTREDTAVKDVVDERLLSRAALDAGVVRDAVVRPAGARGPVRFVAVQVEPHPRRTRDGNRQSDLVVLATSLLDLPADLIALIYLHRYTVELFFRTLKQLLGLRHLLSQREEGVDIQVYCTVIVCLLLCLITGRRPDKATRNMVGWHLIGLASRQELLDHLNRPDNTGAKKRAKDEVWKRLGV